MSTHFKGAPKSSYKEQKRISLYCSEKMIKKMDFIADSIGWSRNALVVESILHLIRLIEDFTSHLVPNYVIQLHSLEQFNRINLSEFLKESDSEKIKLTSIAIHPVILNKIDHFSDAIGWSRNSFIDQAIIHALRMIQDKTFKEIPTVVKLARTMISPINKFLEEDSNKSIDPAQTEH